MTIRLWNIPVYPFSRLRNGFSDFYKQQKNLWNNSVVTLGITKIFLSICTHTCEWFEWNKKPEGIACSNRCRLAIKLFKTNQFSSSFFSVLFLFEIKYIFAFYLKVPEKVARAKKPSGEKTSSSSSAVSQRCLILPHRLWRHRRDITIVKMPGGYFKRVVGRRRLGRVEKKNQVKKKERKGKTNKSWGGEKKEEKPYWPVSRTKETMVVYTFLWKKEKENFYLPV